MADGILLGEGRKVRAKVPGPCRKAAQSDEAGKLDTLRASSTLDFISRKFGYLQHLIYIETKKMRNEVKGRIGRASLLAAIIGTALVAPCLAGESQAPLGLNAVSRLKWEGCGELSNHTVECRYVRCSIWNLVDKNKALDSMSQWIISTRFQIRHSRFP